VPTPRLPTCSRHPQALGPGRGSGLLEYSTDGLIRPQRVDGRRYGDGAAHQRALRHRNKLYRLIVASDAGPLALGIVRLLPGVTAT
jgi:hypothetical protein